MNPVLYMIWRYLAFHKVKTTILVASITLIVYLPVGLDVLVSQSARALTARAEATPLVVGAKGSPLELVLNSLYFESDTPAVMRYGEVERVSDSGLAGAIPLYTRFSASGRTIVGTSLDYFAFRGLRTARGRHFGMLGECVLGAAAARLLRADVGDSVLSSPETAFDIAGVYPLKMRVVGVLAPSDSPDDEAVFVDIKTAWVIEGLAHGHADLSRPEQAPRVLRRDGRVVIGNASVVEFNEITPENVSTFHFHGDPAEFPVTACIAAPEDFRSGTLLLGRYLGAEELVQIVKPDVVIEDLLSTILTVQSYVVTAVLVVAASTLATAVLVFLLSLRLRRKEIETLQRLGGSRGRVFAILAGEVVMVLVASGILAAGLTILTAAFGFEAIRALVM
ncbi:MAG: ABC transporter permease [Planctomycetota bacterium]|jgi:putative ABC transport system permease protein